MQQTAKGAQSTQYLNNTQNTFNTYYTNRIEQDIATNSKTLQQACLLVLAAVGTL